MANRGTAVERRSARGAPPVRGKGRAHPQSIEQREPSFSLTGRTSRRFERRFVCIRIHSRRFRFRPTRTSSSTKNSPRTSSRRASPAIPRRFEIGRFAGSRSSPHFRTRPDRCCGTRPSENRARALDLVKTLLRHGARVHAIDKTWGPPLVGGMLSLLKKAVGDAPRR